jgi:hypothetical protein
MFPCGLYFFCFISAYAVLRLVILKCDVVVRLTVRVTDFPFSVGVWAIPQTPGLPATHFYVCNP